VKHTLYFIYLLIFVGITGCKKSDDGTSKSQYQKDLEEYNKVTEGLKDYFPSQEYFYMGAAISPAILDNSDKVRLINRHFNSLTAENQMKWSSLQPTEGNFNFTDADKIVAFAQANGMKVRGHCLCWHNQVPAWVFKDGDADASKELVLQRLRTHITTVVNHFKGKVYAWDVVNEAIDDGSSTYRASKWYTICGEDYIFEAFAAARAADPDAKLFYNDYSAINTTKRDKIYDLLVKLNDQNLVDGMGLQGHWNIEYPSSDLITDAFEKYRSLGIDLQITELDVSVYTSNSDPESLYTTVLEQKQTVAYGRFFIAFRNYKSNITGVTFWGLADDNTWLDNFPVTGRKNYPLLFDGNLDPKPAYFEIIDF
jgi:endo-1,4-beta-xylanase